MLQRVTVGEICVAGSDAGGNLFCREWPWGKFVLQRVTVGEICVAESDRGGNFFRKFSCSAVRDHLRICQTSLLSQTGTADPFEPAKRKNSISHYS